MLSRYIDSFLSEPDSINKYHPFILLRSIIQMPQLIVPYIGEKRV